MRNFIVILSVITLTGCAGMSKQDQGVIAGAGLGAVVGSQIGGGSIVGGFVGAIVGSVIGSNIGQQLDDRDRLIIEKEHRYAFENSPDTSIHRWRNPDNGHYGEITPKRSYTENHHLCREYETVIYIDGHRHIGHGVACRNHRGEWEVRN